MIRELTEKAMPVRDGEQRFSQEMSKAFFSLGIKPPTVTEKIEEVWFRSVDYGDSRFNIVVDLSRTARGLEGKEERKSVLARVPTIEVAGEARASTLVSHMNDPSNLNRANRALHRSGEIRDWSLVIGVPLGSAVILDLIS